MIKFIAIALLAVTLVDHVSAEDEASQETGLLMGNAKLFSEYCLKERQTIKDDIRIKVNQKSSQVFKMFFNQFVVEIADEVMDVTREEIERYADQIKTPPSLESAPAESLSEEEITNRLEVTLDILEHQPEPQAQPQGLSGFFGRFRNAATSVASTAKMTVTSALYLRLARLRTMMGKVTFLQSLVDACEQIDEYEKQLEENLEDTKKELVAEHDQEEVQKFINNVTVRNLQCQTTRAISRLQGFCTIITGGSKLFLKAIGSFYSFDLPAPSSEKAQERV